MRARLYEPSGAHTRAALLTSGLHASGIDEPRLVRLAQQIAGSHIAVVTPDIPELSRFEIAPAITDAIEEAGGWLASDATLAPDHTAALMGISFSGGLSVVAAGRPSLRGRVAYVFSLGGHDDLTRVLRYLCTGHEPRPMPDVQLGSAARDADFVLPPHDYGVAVILLSLADRLVPAAQVRAAARGGAAVSVGLGAGWRGRQGARAGGVRHRCGSCRRRCPSPRQHCSATCSNATSPISARGCYR